MAPGESSSAPRLLVVLLLGILSNNLVLCLDKKYAGIGSKVKCSAVKVFSPKSVEEVSQAVLDARKQGVTVRAVGKLSTPNDMICTGGYVLDMLAMNKIVVDEKSMVVTAEAGALFEDIYEVLHRMGYSLTASASKFSGSTVGGFLGTGSFISSLKHPALFDDIIRISLMDGRGSILSLSGGLLEATGVNLGLMGVVVSVTFPIVPRFQVVMKVSVAGESYILSKQFVEDARKYDIFSLAWYKSQRRVAVTTGTFLRSYRKGANSTVDFGYHANEHTPGFARGAEAAVALALNGNTTDLCEYEAGNFRAQVSKTNKLRECCGLKGFIAGDGEHRNPAYGWMHKMTASTCPEGECVWDYQGPKFETVSRTLAISLEHLPAAFKLITKTMVERDICSLASYGVQITFLRRSKKYLSLSYGQDMAVIQITLPMRKDNREPTQGHEVVRELEVKLLLKFNGRPSWSSAHPMSPSNVTPEEIYPEWQTFEGERKKLDSRQVFGNEFHQFMTGKREPSNSKHCEVLGTCTCSKDVHCGLHQTCQTKSVNMTSYSVCVTDL